MLGFGSADYIVSERDCRATQRADIAEGLRSRPREGGDPYAAAELRRRPGTKIRRVWAASRPMDTGVMGPRLRGDDPDAEQSRRGEPPPPRMHFPRLAQLCSGCAGYASA